MGMPAGSPYRDRYNEWMRTRVRACSCDYCRGAVAFDVFGAGTGYWGNSAVKAGQMLQLDEFQCEFKRQAAIAVQQAAQALGPWIVAPPALSNTFFTITGFGGGGGPVVPPEAKSAKPTPHGGCHCTRCNNPNPWAEPNRPDGSYVCWACR